jgi:hypothetical protein
MVVSDKDKGMRNVFRIGWDIDGVGCDFDDTYLAYLQFKGLGHLWKSGPTEKPFWNYYRDFGVSDPEFVAHCNEAADLGILYNGPVLPGYAEGIGEVALMGHHIIIATDRPFGSTPLVSQAITVEWFRNNGIEYDELHFTSDKTDADCDFFIDDKLENYDALVAAGTNAFLLNRRMNAVEGGDARNRVDDIESYVNAIAVATQKGYRDLTFA